MRVMLQFMYAARLHSVAALMEHPAFPHWVPSQKKPASSSRLPELLDLLKYPEVDEVTFDQGTLQAKSVKPTTFHLVNFPQMKSALVNRNNASRCTSGQAKQLDRLHGLDAQGQFKTAPSKQYPSDMCMLMARATCEFLQDTIPAKRGTMPPWEEIVSSEAFQFFVPLDPFLEAHAWGQFGADCARSHNGHNAQAAAHGHNAQAPAAPHGHNAQAADLSHQQAQHETKLTEQQLARIEGNRQKALSIKRSRFASIPIVHLPESQEEAVGPPSNFRYHSSTSQHRRKFKFGKITAQDARSNTQSNRPSAESGSACAAERHARQS